MVHIDGRASPNPSSIPVSRHRIPRLSTPSSSRSLGSHERGESSAAGRSSLHDVTAASTAVAHAAGYSTADQASSRSQTPEHEQARRRSYKPRSSGGFLLSNVLSHDTSKINPTSRDDGRRASRIPVDSRRGKSPVDVSARPGTSPATTGLGLGISGQGSRGDGGTRSPNLSVEGAYRDRDQDPRLRFPTRIPSPSPSRSVSPIDVDSTQIVNMALNLSESRRLASRRYIPSPVPPRLSPVPDAQAGGGLQQHLQQQRRASRNMSPRPDHVVKSVSGRRLSSPLQSTLDPEGTYTYHFSSSTLDRGQKAREYLELMAQYRRLLQFLPPLKPDASDRSRPSTSQPPTSPTASSSSSNPPSSLHQTPLGRPYNPLQYIRNRKVRARERKTIDGEAQGFADVMKVTEWVDQTAASAAASPLTSGAPSVPLFPGAQAYGDDGSVPTNIPRPTSALGKARRPRNDWSIDPADMLADAYWLEQDDNKYLIEDRHYSKIFPPKQGSLRPPSIQASELGKPTNATSTGQSEEKNSRFSFHSDTARPTKGEIDMSLSGARDRARQKLHSLRGRHRHANSAHPHDLLRFGKISFSDSSDNEGDRRRKGRSGTISAYGTDLLEKQMTEMLAKEAQEEQKENASDAGDKELKMLPGGTVSHDGAPRHHGKEPDPRDSYPGLVEGQERALRAHERQVSPFRRGRVSLEVPGQNTRPSLDLDSSVPATPELGPSRTGNSYLPTIGMDLSPPSSRPVSPARKPFSKVKNIFRDRSRDRSRDHSRERISAQEKEIKSAAPSENELRIDSPMGPSENPTSSLTSMGRAQSLDLPRSKSPAHNRTPKTANQGHKSHRSIGSIRFKSDEAVGLRGIFKGGAKLDGIIREGVSKVGDLLWRKDADRDDTPSSASGDESGAEQKRGRLRESAEFPQSGLKPIHETQPPPHYPGTLPPFKSVVESTSGNKTYDDINSLAIQRTLPGSTSPRPDRFNKLKPPRIDVSGNSPSASPVMHPSKPPDMDVSDSELRSRDEGDGGRLERPRRTSQDLDTVLSIPVVKEPVRHGSAAPSLGSRQWSNRAISDRDASSPRRSPVSKREVARLRALILSSGIKAMEIARRAHEPQPLFAPSAVDTNKVMTAMGTGLTQTDVLKLLAGIPTDANDDDNAKGDRNPSAALIHLSAPQTELFPQAARVLSLSIDRSTGQLRATAGEFASSTAPGLQRRGDALRARLAADLSELTRRCADDADDAGRDLLDMQRLKVKHLTDAMGGMLRRRRRRAPFRWARRAGWLAVEYLLVGLMWWAWFVVVVARVIGAVGGGVAKGVRWLFWL
ncbi:hypothetical protein DL764_001266 [Monosporascus ibericus]|uniref:Uncharacterized protein n=1 Tax=Monosporascus ibericus TaxID=155417 RepID=A0A4Q4TTQ1_9PEZI|nr:hypothetical protein DL764_001266 [Monosporascus ibericus]